MATSDMRIVGDYLSVVVKGVLTVDDFMKITDNMYDFCVERSIHKVIIDVEQTAGTFSNTDKIEFAKYAVTILKDQIDKYAYVYPHDLTDYSSQLIARGRGMNARAYASIDDAITWMEEN
jgi:hypothetical protein